MKYNITPKDYLSDTPPPRIVGSECEYDIQSTNSEGFNVPIKNYITSEAIRKAGYTVVYHFLSNGGALLEDVGHIEYATPECIGVEDATKADLAGIKVVTNVVNASGVEHRGVYRHAAEYLSENAVLAGSSNDVTHGYHENYLSLEPDTDSEGLIKSLLPAHIATRLYAWSGTVRSGFVLGQKVWGAGGDPVVFSRERLTKHGVKPMVMLPDYKRDYNKVGSGWRRIEVRSSDPSSFQTSRYLSFATTSLVIRLIEHSDKFGKELDEMELLDPAVQARDVARDLTLSRPIELKNGKFMSAVDVQEKLLGAVRVLSDRVKLPDDELRAIPLWQEVLDDIRRADLTKGEYGALHKKIGWAALYVSLVARDFEPKRLVGRNSEVMGRVLVWDRILPTGSSMVWDQRLGDRLFDEGAIEELVLDPPRGGRAEARVELIQKEKYKLRSMNWGVATRGNNDSRTILSMPDPYSKRIVSNRSDFVASTVEI